MELILLPVLLLIQFTVYLLMAVVGVVFNLLFRSDRPKLDSTDDTLEPHPTKPENPWTVFAYSIVATLILALIAGSICYYMWDTQRAFLTGFIVMGVLGIFSSITAATGEAPPM